MSPDYIHELKLDVERLTSSIDGQIALQDEEAISLLNLKSGVLTPLLADRQGRELVAMLDGGRWLSMHETEGLVGMDRRGVRFAQSKLGADDEFADARVLGDGKTVVLLLAEMLGGELDTGTPRFRFALVSSTLAMTSIDGQWSRWPRIWTIDPFRSRLLIASDPQSISVTVFDLKSAKRVGELDWPIEGADDFAMTGLDASSLRGLAAIGLRRRDGSGCQLSVFNESENETITLAEFADGETVHKPLWSPDEKRILFRKGEGTSAELMTIKLKSSIEDPTPKSLIKTDEDADAVWCGPNRVVVLAADNEVAVFDL